MLIENHTIKAFLDFEQEALTLSIQEKSNKLNSSQKIVFQDTELLCGDYWNAIYLNEKLYDINLYNSNSYSEDLQEENWTLCLYPVVGFQRQDETIIQIPLYLPV
jgi:hypothetical protein